MRKKKILTVILTMCMAFGLCGGIVGISAPVRADAASKIKLSAAKKTVNVGKSFTLKVTGKKGKITWKSSDESVAVVTAKGKVTAVSEGTANIKAKVGAKKLVCKVIVKSVPVNKDIEGYYECADIENERYNDYFKRYMTIYKPENGYRSIYFGWGGPSSKAHTSVKGENLDGVTIYYDCGLYRIIGDVTFKVNDDGSITVTYVFDENNTWRDSESSHEYTYVKVANYGNVPNWWKSL